MKHLYTLSKKKHTSLSLNTYNNVSEYKRALTSLSILFLMIIFSANTYAAVFQTAANGNWTNAATWVAGNIPGTDVGSNDTIIINHHVTFNPNNADLNIYGVVIINSSGKLNHNSSSRKTFLDIGAYLVNNGKMAIGNFETRSEVLNNGRFDVNVLTVTISGYLDNRDSIFASNNNSKINNSGRIDNHEYIFATEFDNNSTGTLEMFPGSYIHSKKPIDNIGGLIINNFGTIYGEGNFINNNGTITGSGGNYIVDGNFNSQASGVITCNGENINICAADGVSNPINSVSNNSFLDSTCVSICGVPLITPLPVKMLYIKAEAGKNNTADIHWATASEINNEYFELHRSMNGTEWETIANIYSTNPNSSSAQYYSYTDHLEDVSSPYIYYRIKQVDFDGQFEMFPIVYVSLKPSDVFQVKAYPNPASEKLNISLNGASEKETISITLVNLYGQVLIANEYLTASASRSLSFNLEEVSSGMYYLVVVRNDEEHVTKVMINR